ncbi:DUF423 domain-containing protein [Sphingobacterium corticibacter]|uniref:DUF423 domain-containing protein n=1 Tax=Sphingobacterium corticibacter TaxID=2171749 RepID=A0A2T8HIS5_9SPHI|nr:DUF423 domain-containing protein [Sphingobacterium corticibacter]PVH25357.1 DUF423 domain-containing protein [Sphingobacterium corticibacter]
MQTTVLMAGAVFGFLGIVFGAFGAHALKKILSEEKVTSFEVGVRYQMYSAITLLVIGFGLDFDLRIARLAFFGIFYGTIVFSGSIYLLSFKEYWKAEGLKFLGPITPLGGLLLLFGWACIFLSII